MLYLEAVIEGFSFKQLSHIYLGNSRGEFYLQWSCGPISAILVGVAPYVRVSQVF